MQKEDKNIMETLYKADVFFFVSTISVGVATLLLVIVSWKFISLINEVRRTARVLRRQVVRTSALGNVFIGRALRMFALSKAFINFFKLKK
jgi:hypothetical protein